ncbi:MAG: NepR family anti-sigma factor [Geminicoccaceae bacterium]
MMNANSDRSPNDWILVASQDERGTRHPEPAAENGDPRDDKSGTPTGAIEPDWIGRQLKRIYDEVAAEPIPEDMLTLLEQLDEQSSDDEETR